MYVARRAGFLFVVVWVALTIVFFVPRLSERNPVRERFNQLARNGGFTPKDLENIIASYNEKFGLDRTLIQQYSDYVGGLLRGDLGPSLFLYPKTVTELIMDALPWTIMLLLITTILSFILGNLVGALAAWPRSPGWVKGLMAPLLTIQGIPPYLLGLLLIFFLAFRLKLFPIGGAADPGVVPVFTLSFLANAAKYQVLPAMALILFSIGFYALGMRGMGVTIQGEDYVNFAEHKGLSPYKIFTSYYVRNALLPQVTDLALKFGTVITSGILVELLFGLPGLGDVLGRAVTSNDFFVIYGISLFIIIAIAVLMFVIDIIYPLLDPRVKLDSN